MDSEWRIYRDAFVGLGALVVYYLGVSYLVYVFFRWWRERKKT
jgi:threonine/homoserine/homoserine lactone efflux protein